MMNDGAERRAFLIIARSAPLVSLLVVAATAVLARGRLPAFLAHRSSCYGRGEAMCANRVMITTMTGYDVHVNNNKANGDRGAYDDD